MNALPGGRCFWSSKLDDVIWLFLNMYLLFDHYVFQSLCLYPQLEVKKMPVPLPHSD